MFSLLLLLLVVRLFVVVIRKIFGYTMSANNGLTGREEEPTTSLVAGVTIAVRDEMVGLTSYRSG